MEFQSTKVQQGLAFCASTYHQPNHPPAFVTLGAPCREQEVGDCQGPHGYGENQRGGPQALSSEQSRESSRGTLGSTKHLFLVSPDQVGGQA